MKDTFRPGQTVWLEMAGERCEIRELLGSGGQAEVYRAAIQGRECALKWYYPEQATTGHRAGIERLLKKGAPSDSFLWPCDLALCQGLPSFGYVTPLRPARFRHLGDLLSRRVDPSFRTLTTVCLNLAEAFTRLHGEGLCYSRFCFGNIFFDPDTGEVCLCENDDVAAEGEDWKGGVGTPRFLAPELIARHTGPSAATDLHSLAVLLFYILMVHHPLEGRHETELNCLDLDAVRKLYGPHAVFIFDPKNLGNLPVPGLQDNALVFWNFYPGYVRDIFLRAFGPGLYDPQARIGENEWRGLFSRMRDQIYYCDHCGTENFLPDSGNLPGALPEQECWSCQESLPSPLRLRLVPHAVVLNQDTVLFAHHIDANRRNDFSQIMAEMAPHPSRENVWGLKNVSAATWNSFAPDGASVAVPSGRSVILMPGLRVRFGNVEGAVL
jgi:DNA-binding helix-hairpin-helix protein with protein kinase domain